MKKLAQNIVSVRMRHPGWHLHHCSVFSFIFPGQTAPVMQSCMNCRFPHAGGRMRLYTFPRAAGAENARRIRRFVRIRRTFHNFLRFSPPGGASPSPAMLQQLELSVLSLAAALLRITHSGRAVRIAFTP